MDYLIKRGIFFLNLIKRVFEDPKTLLLIFGFILTKIPLLFSGRNSTSFETCM